MVRLHVSPGPSGSWFGALCSSGSERQVPLGPPWVLDAVRAGPHCSGVAGSWGLLCFAWHYPHSVVMVYPAPSLPPNPVAFRFLLKSELSTSFPGKEQRVHSRSFGGLTALTIKSPQFPALKHVRPVAGGPHTLFVAHQPWVWHACSGLGNGHMKEKATKGCWIFPSWNLWHFYTAGWLNWERGSDGPVFGVRAAPGSGDWGDRLPLLTLTLSSFLPSAHQQEFIAAPLLLMVLLVKNSNAFCE